VTPQTPLKQITTFKLSKTPIFVAAASFLEHRQPKKPISIESVPVPLPPDPSQILEQIGAKLRELREHNHLSLDDMSARTQIQPRLIQAIEEGHIEMLPEPVYVRGMVKRYGNSLGLNGTELSQQVPTWEKNLASFEPTTKLQITSFNYPARVKPLYAYLGYTAIVIGIGAGASHAINNAIKPQYSPVVGVGDSLPLGTASLFSLGRGSANAERLPKQTENRNILRPQQAVVTPAPTELPDVPVGIVVKQPTWAQIGIDGITKYTGSLKVGTQFNWTAKKQVTISTNNAGGLLFSRDLQPPQPLGKIGQKQTITIKVSK
jgi:transcriptional regulator with XRE-family HTH domain